MSLHYRISCTNINKEGNEYDEELLGDSLITAHVNRFGKYRLDLNRKPLELYFDVPVMLS
jgi:hypothetical protein